MAASGGLGPAGPGLVVSVAESPAPHGWPSGKALVINSLSPKLDKWGFPWGDGGALRKPFPISGTGRGRGSHQDHLPACPAGVTQGTWHSAPWSPSQEEHVPGSEVTPFQVLGICLCPPQPRKGQSGEGGHTATGWAVPVTPVLGPGDHGPLCLQGLAR